MFLVHGKMSLADSVQWQQLTQGHLVRFMAKATVLPSVAEDEAPLNSMGIIFQLRSVELHFK